MINNTVNTKAVSSRIRKVLGAVAAITLMLSTTIFSIPNAQASSDVGGTYTTGRAYSFETKAYVVRFLGNEYAEVNLKGDGDTDLDLFVYSPDGQLVARSLGRYDSESVRFWVSRTGTYRIEIKNRDDYANDWVMTTN